MDTYNLISSLALHLSCELHAVQHVRPDAPGKEQGIPLSISTHRRSASRITPYKVEQGRNISEERGSAGAPSQGELSVALSRGGGN
jgi:hypothetical protein